MKKIFLIIFLSLPLLGSAQSWEELERMALAKIENKKFQQKGETENFCLYRWEVGKSSLVIMLDENKKLFLISLTEPEKEQIIFSSKDFLYLTLEEYQRIKEYLNK